MVWAFRLFANSSIQFEITLRLEKLNSQEEKIMFENFSG